MRTIGASPPRTADGWPTSLDEWAERFGLGGKAVLTTVETAAVLRICERSVREGIKAGWIPHVRFGRRVLVPVPRLIAMLAESTNESVHG